MTPRKRKGRPTIASKMGIEEDSGSKLRGFLNDLENHPAELRLAQRLYMLRIVARLSYQDIADRSADLHNLGNGQKLSVGTVYNYIKAYARVAYRYADSEPLKDEINAIEAEICRLVSKRQKAKKLGEDIKLTREIREYTDMLHGLKGIKRTMGAHVFVQQDKPTKEITPEQAMRMFALLEEIDPARLTP